MDISLFDYSYPQELVAQHPLPKRDASRLLVLDRRSGTWKHRQFRDFPDYFSEQDTLVFNNTKVFPARLYGKTPGGRTIEVLLLPNAAGPVVAASLCQGPGLKARSAKGMPCATRRNQQWPCLVRPARKLKDGSVVHFSENLSGTLSSKEGEWAITFSDPEKFQEELPQIGLPPLPPYIKRDKPCEEDNERYQTIYAEKVGAAAAPTAGFHFTEKILRELQQKECRLCYCTLHVGRDTFEPVRVQEIEQHRMHGEDYEIPETTANDVTGAKQKGQPITVIGTTTVRTLESAWTDKGLSTGSGHTEVFFYPGYTFKVVDRLLTNFHQPQSTLLMLVSGFAGRELILEAYQDAIRERYRLFSYGDAMLIL